MADDIEAFLRRAAQKRRQQQQSSRPQPPRQRPEYSNARAERVAQATIVEAEEVVEAEIIDEGLSSLQNRHLQDSHLAEVVELADDNMEQHIHQVFDHEVGSLAHKEGAAHSEDGGLSAELVKMLQSPSGLRQAILIREILDRPEHRW